MVWADSPKAEDGGEWICTVWSRVRTETWPEVETTHFLWPSLSCWANMSLTSLIRKYKIRNTPKTQTLLRTEMVLQVESSILDILWQVAPKIHITATIRIHLGCACGRCNFGSTLKFCHCIWANTPKSKTIETHFPPEAFCIKNSQPADLAFFFKNHFSFAS